MKKIFMLTIVSTILFSISVSSQVIKKDTCCPCISQSKPVKKVPTSPRPWRYMEEKNQAKGLISGSFNDSVVIEDYSGITTFPTAMNIPKGFFRQLFQI